MLLANVVATDAGIYKVVVTGSCGTPVTNSATLTISGPPVITCSSNKTVELSLPWTFDPPTANYPVVVLGTVTNTDGHCGNTFDATRTWEASDTCGHSTQCSQTVTVVDATPPTITCRTNKIVQLGSAWDFDPPSATDTGGTDITITIVSTITNTTSHCGDTFDATRTWLATDACSNSASCAQTVTVRDTTPPIITCPTNMVLECPAEATTNVTGSATASDASSPVTITYSDSVSNTCGGAKVITRTWRATDACSNSASCVQIITVRDTTSPTIFCPGDLVLECPADTTTNNTGVATAEDGCGSVTIRYGDVVATNCAGTKVISRTWTATDQCGNSTNCVQTITVQDTTQPTITAPGDVVLECPNNATTNLTGVATAQDTCGSVTITYSDTVSNTCGGSKIISRTWTARDACGNSANAVQTITVQDTTSPRLTQPRNVVLECPADIRTNNTGAATATDACSAVAITFNDEVTTNCGGTKVIARTWTATDVCGNATNAVQTITVRDITPPSITCPTNLVLECPADIGTNNTGVATAQDACGSVTISYNDSVSNICAGAQVISRTWTATDECGNSANCVQTITVRDTTPPTITCPTNVVLECPADTSTNQTGVATAQDTCGSVAISFSDVVTMPADSPKSVSLATCNASS